MAFHHISGATTLGAANAVADWFTTFEAWITGVVGWTVVAGAGTDNLRISSPGKSGLMTMLFAHVWRMPGTETVRTEVSDDAIPTHETTRGGQDLDSHGARFQYWMSADLDSIVIVWKARDEYYTRYIGLIMPFALNPVDETYYSVSTNGLNQSTILRNHLNLWDQDDTIYYNDFMHEMGPDRDNGHAVLGGCYHGDQNEIAGQFKHISCNFNTKSVYPEDVITSAHQGGSSTWVVLSDSGQRTFALRTGGTLPPGPPETHFTYQTGLAPNIAGWFASLVNFMVGNGWSATNITPWTGFAHDWEFNSAGESGTDDIWIRVYFAGTPHVIAAVADSHYLTPGRQETFITEMTSWVVGIFPANYYFAGDRDCLLMTADDGLWHVPCWAGKVYSAPQGLSSLFMNHVCQNMDGVGVTRRRILLDHNGGWDAGITYNYYADGNSSQNSNPNAYDGVSYMVWPQCSAEFLTCALGNRHELIGIMKYFYSTHGGGIAALDTITDGAQIFMIFTCFYAAAARYWCMRTDAPGPGANFPGRRLYPNDGNVSMSPMIDAGEITKTPPTGLERGNINEDYNIVTRGHSKRIDYIPGH